MDAGPSPVKVTAVSDLHGNLPDIEPCDVLVIAGDIVPLEVQDSQADSARWLDSEFRDWLERSPAADVVGIAGNHDFIFLHPESVPTLPWTYLQDSGAELASLRFWGSPWTTPMGGWAFEAPDFPGLGIVFELAPADVDVLVTHCPPYRFGDGVGDFDPHQGVQLRRAGSKSLLEVVEDRRLALHVFGHIHEGRGRWKLGDSLLANVSILDEHYQHIHEPMTFTV